MTSFPWHVHQYPFPHDGQQNPCRPAITGGHYDPLGASSITDYTQNCASNQSLCEIGDLSGRLGPLNASGYFQQRDPLLSLYGIRSIIGRSVVIHFSNQSRLVCANIGYPPSMASNLPSATPAGVDLLYVPFRNRFTGSIYFRQHTTNSMASVYADLVYANNSSANSMGHNWHVHQFPLDAAGMDCGVAGRHYNPRQVDVTSEQYATYCTPRNQTACEIGDLSNKGGPFDVVGGVVKHFYSDTDLPLSGAGDSIAGRSIVIHESGRGLGAIACANISRFSPLEAEAIFTAQDNATITGRIRFTQTSPFDQTSVAVQLMGLDGMAGGYHVHVSPIGPTSLGSPRRCNATFAGGHWNPLGVSYSNVTNPITSDDYEIGDLSGKFGGLGGRSQINETFYDPNVPLFGPLGIIGRSVVIHQNDTGGTRWACADIAHTRPVVEVSFSINSSSVEGMVTLVQPADDPFADTTVIVQLKVLVDLEPPVQVPITSSVVSASSSVGVITPSPSLAPVLTSTSLNLIPTPTHSSSSNSSLPVPGVYILYISYI